MKKIIQNLKDGNLVIIPTDTVYGISCDALNREAVEKVFIAKKRENKPLLILVSSVDMLKDYVSEINDLEKKLLDRFSPGMLTILFKKNNNIFDEITCGSEYIGIRIPDNTLLLDVINELGNPIVSTSANISGEVITNVNMINDELKKHISYIYDDGEKTNISSTLVKVENNKIKILREGVLADIIKKEYNKYIGD